VQPDDEVLLAVGDVAALDVGPEVVEPPEPAALAAPRQVGALRHVPPAAFAMSLHVGGQHLVLLAGPRASLDTFLGTARRPPPHRSLCWPLMCLCAQLGRRIYARAQWRWSTWPSDIHRARAHVGTCKRGRVVALGSVDDI
jgi:hypothetical protein